MNIRRDQIESDPNWEPSLGEQFWNYNYRNGHYHAVCDSTTGNCNVHYDKDDPHESFTSLVKHLLGNKKVQLLVGVVITDQILFDGKVRKKAKKVLFG